MEYVGIDLGKRSSQVCIGDAEGVVVLERRIQTRRVSLAKLFGGGDQTGRQADRGARQERRGGRQAPHGARSRAGDGSGLRRHAG